METIKTTDHDRGLGLRPWLYAGSVCDDSAAGAAHAVIVALYKCNLLLPLPLLELCVSVLMYDTYLISDWICNCCRRLHNFFSLLASQSSKFNRDSYGQILGKFHV